MRFALFLCLCLALMPAQAQAEEAGWIDLFNGRDLQGWTRRGGEAEYRVEKGAIVGSTVLDTSNTFLCTDRDYGDFTLELEFKVDPDLNSGVQIRSHVYDQEKTAMNRRQDQGQAGRHGLRLPGRDRSQRPCLDGWNLRRISAGVAGRSEPRRGRAQGLQSRCVEPLQNRGTRLVDQDLGQRCTRRRSLRRNDRERFYRTAGPQRRHRRRAEGNRDLVAQHPHQA